jgi:hypothetical protein
MASINLVENLDNINMQQQPIYLTAQIHAAKYNTMNSFDFLCRHRHLLDHNKNHHR